MGKKPQRFTWPQAKKCCRLNQDDIEMAKRLGFGPDALIRNIPDPKEKWKAPVKRWVRELYAERFGCVLGANVMATARSPLESSEEVARQFGEELYWEEYRERNEGIVPPSSPKERRTASALHRGSTDEDVPF